MSRRYKWLLIAGALLLLLILTVWLADLYPTKRVYHNPNVLQRIVFDLEQVIDVSTGEVIWIPAKYLPDDWNQPANERND